MSARSSIVNALVVKLKEINGASPFTVNLSNNVLNKMKFWDDVIDFPALCVVAGMEDREYLPGNFKWGFLKVSIKVYCKQEDPAAQLESLIEDIEYVIDHNLNLTYGVGPGQETADIKVVNIVTDEGLLIPYGIAEVNISIQYQVL